VPRPRSRLVLVAAAVTTGLAVIAACDTDDGRQMDEPSGEQRDGQPTTTSSSLPGEPVVTTGEPVVTMLAGSSVPETIEAGTVAAPFVVSGPWADGGLVLIEHTCDGPGTAPVISWTAPPAGTVELALVVTDRDAEDFVHYAVRGLPPTAGETGVPIAGAVEGTNDFGAPGWGGPCPPPGTTHQYVWTVYAVAQPTTLPDGFTGRQLYEQMLASAFASAQFTGTYTRPG